MPRGRFAALSRKVRGAPAPRYRKRARFGGPFVLSLPPRRGHPGAPFGLVCPSTRHTGNLWYKPFSANPGPATKDRSEPSSTQSTWPGNCFWNFPIANSSSRYQATSLRSLRPENPNGILHSLVSRRSLETDLRTVVRIFQLGIAAGPAMCLRRPSFAACRLTEPPFSRKLTLAGTRGAALSCTLVRVGVV